MVTVLLCRSYPEGRWSQTHSPSCIWCLRRSWLVIPPWAVTVFWTLPCFRPRERSCLGTLGAGGCRGPLKSLIISALQPCLEGKRLFWWWDTQFSGVSLSRLPVTLGCWSQRLDPAALMGRVRLSIFNEPVEQRHNSEKQRKGVSSLWSYLEEEQIERPSYL